MPWKIVLLGSEYDPPAIGGQTETMMQCKLCGSSKHEANECRISKKRDLLEATLEEFPDMPLEEAAGHAGFIVLDCGNVDEVADKVDAVHTLLT